MSKALLSPSRAPSPPALLELLIFLCSTSFHILYFISIKFASFNWFPPGNTTSICCISASNLHGYVTLLMISALPDTAVHCISPKHLSSSVWYQYSWDPTLESYLVLYSTKFAYFAWVTEHFSYSYDFIISNCILFTNTYKYMFSLILNIVLNTHH